MCAKSKTVTHVQIEPSVTHARQITGSRLRILASMRLVKNKTAESVTQKVQQFVTLVKIASG